MRTGEIKIGEKSYPLCFSLWTLRECCDRYGSMSGAFDAMSGGQDGGDKTILEESLWMLRTMLHSGYQLQQLSGEAADPPPDDETILFTCSLADIREALTGAIVAGSRRDVEVTPGKKAKAAPEAP